MHIDDDIEYLLIMKKVCESGGYNYTGYSNIEIALESISTVRPDIILLDLHFKTGFDGTALLSAYKAKIEAHDYKPPVIVLSSFNSKEHVDFVMDLGADGYMSKGSQPDILINMISDYLLQSQKTAESSATETDEASLAM